MATYLATVTIGRFRLHRSRAAGVPSLRRRRPARGAASKRPLRAIPRILELFNRLFGPYPFGQVGAIVDHAPKVGYALETQTRPIFDRRPQRGPDRPRARPPVVRRQRQHRRAGRDIWLNEGFATWAQWRYAQSIGGACPAQRLRAAAARPRRARPRSGTRRRRRSAKPAAAVRDVGLRARRRWRSRRCASGSATTPSTRRCAPGSPTHRDGNATIDEFIALAESTLRQGPRRPVPALSLQAGQTVTRWSREAFQPAG